MAMVLDASIALAWLFREEHCGLADQVIRDGLTSECAAPALFWLETANVLHVRLRRNKLSLEDRDAALRDLWDLTIASDTEAGRLPDIVALSDRHSLTVYDAAYLELAKRLGGTLATLDAKLAAAGRAEGLDVRSP